MAPWNHWYHANGNGLPTRHRARRLPVRDRAHQLNVYRYITEHARRGAAIWTFRDGLA